MSHSCVVNKRLRLEFIIFRRGYIIHRWVVKFFVGEKFGVVFWD